MWPTYDCQVHWQRAERQFQQVEPENRLVARSLESRWNEKLSELNQLEEKYKQYKTSCSWQPSEDDRTEILALSSELPQIWDSPTTTAKDKKRILRTLVEDVTIFAEARKPDVRLGLRWRSQHCEEIHTTKPLSPAAARRHTPETVELIRELALTMNDFQIVSHLASSNIKTPDCKAFTIASIKWIRYAHKIPPFTEKKGLSVKEMAAKFGVATSTVYYWIEHGMVTAKKVAPRNAYDIELDDRKCDELNNFIQNSNYLRRYSVPHQDN